MEQRDIIKVRVHDGIVGLLYLNHQFGLTGFELNILLLLLSNKKSILPR